MDLKYSYISRSTPQVGTPSLLDRDIQLEYYKEIKGLQSLNLDNLLARYRKLREGIVASRAQPDVFILSVYLDSIDLSLKAKNFLELIKALEGALDVLKAIESVRSREIQEYLLLYLITFGANTQEFFKFFMRFTGTAKDHEFSLRVLKALNDPMAFHDFFTIYKLASDNQRIFLDLKIESVRKRYIKVLSKGFKELEANYLLELMVFFSMKELLEFLTAVGFTLNQGKVSFRIKQ